MTDANMVADVCSQLNCLSGKGVSTLLWSLSCSSRELQPSKTHVNEFDSGYLFVLNSKLKLHYSGVFASVWSGLLLTTAAIQS